MAKPVLTEINTDRVRRWRLRNPEDAAAMNARQYHRYKAKYPGRIEESRRRSIAKLKNDVLNAYGTVCACCGEEDIRFLTVDHINNDGAAHRKSLTGTNKAAGHNIYRWLRQNNYPPGFQILCMNCNAGRHWNGGECPHKDPFGPKVVVSAEDMHCGRPLISDTFSIRG